jgi:uncharacterized protein YxjI
VLLDYRKFFVKERVAFVKLTDAYDIFDPDTNQPIGSAMDEPPGWAKFARILVNKRFLPTNVNIYEAGSEDPLFSIKKKPGFLRVKVVVCDSHGSEFGTFRSKLFSLGGGFTVFDTTGAQLADVKGDWKGWNFRFLDNAGTELGVVTKKWAGLGKEFFTSADNYIIALSETHEAMGDHATASLMLAAGLAIDLVFKEAS